MRSTRIGRLFEHRLATWSIAAATTCLVAGYAQPVRADSGQITFASAIDASRALVQAVQNRDESALERILGAGPDVTSSGDAAADTLEREQFVRKYQEMHRLVREPNGMVVLYVGAENWPFPIPLASSRGRWLFDSKRGAGEILVRRIGEHESAAIDSCRDLAAASPAQADALNHETAHGYRFRPVDAALGQSVTRAGRGASTAKTITDVKFVAYPVQYRSSGVMTFIVTSAGAVYQRDLGPETARLADGIDVRVPELHWVLVP